MNTNQENHRYKVFAYGKFGLVDKTGNQRVPFLYHSIEDIGNDLFAVRLGQQCGVIDAWGNEIIPIKFENYHYDEDGKMLLLEIADEAITYDLEKREFINIFPKQGYEIDYVSERRLRFTKENETTYGLMDEHGEILRPHSYYQWLGPFHEGMAQVKIDNEYGFINRNGELVISIPNCSAVGHFRDGWTWVQPLDGEIYYIDKTGEMVFFFPENTQRFYNSNFKWGFNFFTNAAEIKRGLLNKQGETVIPAEYDDIIIANENLFLAKKNNKWGAIDLKNSIIIPFEYDRLAYNGEGLVAFLGKNEWGQNKWGIIDRHNNITVPAKYDKIEPFENGLAWFEVAEYGQIEWGYIDTKGNEVVSLFLPDDKEMFDWGNYTFACKDYKNFKYSERDGKWAWYLSSLWGEGYKSELIAPKEKQEILYYETDCEGTENITIGSRKHNICFINGKPTNSTKEIAKHYASLRAERLANRKNVIGHDDYYSSLD